MEEKQLLFTIVNRTKTITVYNRKMNFPQKLYKKIPDNKQYS